MAGGVTEPIQKGSLRTGDGSETGPQSFPCLSHFQAMHTAVFRFVPCTLVLKMCQVAQLLAASSCLLRSVCSSVSQ